MYTSGSESLSSEIVKESDSAEISPEGSAAIASICDDINQAVGQKRRKLSIKETDAKS